MPSLEQSRSSHFDLEYPLKDQATLQIFHFLKDLWNQNLSLSNENLCPTQQAIVDLFHVRSRHFPEERIRTLLSYHQHSIIALEQQLKGLKPQMVGFVVLNYFDPQDLELTPTTKNHGHLFLALMVNPRFQRNGVGTQLGTAAVALAHQHHCDLWSHVEHAQQAERLHQRLAKLGIPGIRQSKACDGAFYYYPCPE